MHLLVVEDDDIVRMLMVEVLDELGYTAIEADTATAALRILENPDQALDLLMTDVGLPDMRGEELAGKAREIRPLLPVLFASGYAESLNVPEGMHMIGKPFSIDQLRDKVVSILGTPDAS
ncbi:putative transcriptional regulatory protein [Pseudomonas reidholzensis]|uniref:Putative transcriptional regulatory protein n=1 Tax=Pseudomonas reidholzensis TaxID=1785162 RepID=A0A383RVH4_9PSED|nr:response regulator [Pseudomonas reidholzensis]SYX90783.1 putative transcriptional regulatory protein [Pseudomonas reidholzensis]